MSAGTGSSTEERQEGESRSAAQGVVDGAQQQAEQAAERAKSTLRDQLDQRTSQAGEQINQQATDLRSVGESLREQGKDGPARAADQLAGYAERVGSYLRDRDGETLLHDVEDLGRRQPWAVGAGALALGFAASRFLKASSRQRYSSRELGGPPAGDPRTFEAPAQPVTGGPVMAGAGTLPARPEM